MTNSRRFPTYNSDMWRNFCRHMEDFENEYFDKVGLVNDMVDKIIVEYDRDKLEAEGQNDFLDEDDRPLIDITLQLSQQSETDMTELTTTTNSQHNSADIDPDFVENMDPNFFECVQPFACPPHKVTFSILEYFCHLPQQCSKHSHNSSAVPDNPPSATVVASQWI